MEINSYYIILIMSWAVFLYSWFKGKIFTTFVFFAIFIYSLNQINWWQFF